MITTINEYKKHLVNEAKKAKASEFDLVIVDVQQGFKKFFGEPYLLALQEYCEDFNRVFQIYDTNKIDHPDYIFPNQTMEIPKKYGGKLDVDQIDYLFTEPMRDYVRAKMNNLQERDMFETINGDYYVYVDAGHEWFICSKEMANLFKDFKKNDRKIMLVGGAGGSRKNPKGECLRDIYITMKAFELNVRYDLDYVYSADGSKFQSITGEPISDEKVKEIAEKLKGRDLFPKKMESARKIMKSIDNLPR